ncbi:hypothetical protein SAE02_61260 [Skermanella aerolata]|uniref:Peptidase metallopeptidase domain-containing protein n=1 Tax=Skermanella aerolata TaxID=393310 RepID=A0A512DZQ6_9PROT|nr:matrixin family metalloprotease [Skermanella aerolata]KJB91915.1 hypothetical protein N826_25700 [Skermanella aerolata KACC 11604]GEO41978.1 hypothetical protein SAE02_61260 [Skermanella aerolata]
MATYQTTTNYALTGDTVLDALTYDTKWGGARGTGATLTYSFHNAASTYGTQATYGTADPFSNTGAPNEVLKTAIRASLAEWTKVANLTFVEVADTGSTSGVLRFGTSSEIDRLGIAGRATTPSTTFERSGNVWLSNNIFYNIKALSPGNYYFQAVMHEIGHALGMSHPFDTGVTLPKD